MRYKDREVRGTIIYSQLGEGGQVLYRDPNRFAWASRGGFERDDIHVSLVNSNGWRPPTTYYSKDNTVEFEWGQKRVRSTRRTLTSTSYGEEVLEGNCSWIPDITPLGGYPVPNIPSNQLDLLQNGNLLKLRDQKINLALNAAELGKTAGGIASSAIKLATSLRAFRRGKFKKSLSTLGLSTKGKGKDSASTWLELQYGILPLMGDCFGAYEEMTRKVRQHGQRKKTDSVFGRTTEFARNQVDIGDFDFWGADKYTATSSVRQILWWEVNNPALLAASSVGLTNPAEIIWELTPWSFVVDWFLPIGDFLGALTASQGFKFLGGTVTTMTDRVTEQWLVAKPPHNNGSDPFTTNTGTCSGRRIVVRKEMRRDVMNPVDVPTFALPRFKDPASTKHALNALALLRSIT